MQKKEDPQDKDSLAYLIRQILGKKFDRKLAAERMRLSPSSLASLLSGYYVPSQHILAMWSEELHLHYDLNRLWEGGPLTLKERLEEKITSLSLASGAKVSELARQVRALLWKIGGKKAGYIAELAKAAGITPTALQMFATATETLLPQWASKNLISGLRTKFPDKAREIEELRVLSLKPRTPEDKPPRATKTAEEDAAAAVEKDSQQTTGALIRQMYKACGLTQPDIERHIKTKIQEGKLGRGLEGKLADIESGEHKVPTTIRRAVLHELCGLCMKRAPKKATKYLPKLGQDPQDFVPQ